jgi:hypothetical protein
MDFNAFVSEFTARYEFEVIAVRIEDHIPDIVERMAACGRTGSILEDTLWYAKLEIITKFARELGIKRVLLGESGARLACKVLSLTCKGRGN